MKKTKNFDYKVLLIQSMLYHILLGYIDKLYKDTVNTGFKR